LHFVFEDDRGPYVDVSDAAGSPQGSQGHVVTGHSRCGREMGHFYFKKSTTGVRKNHGSQEGGGGPLSYLNKVKQQEMQKKKTFI